MNKSLLLALVAVLSGISGAQAHDKSIWIPEFDKALELAKAQKRDVLVEFTGSDWCRPCQALWAEVLGREEFQKEAQKSYILCGLDFPRSDQAKAEVPDQKRNDAVRDQYGVEGYPTVLLMTSEGDVFARTGYLSGGVEFYLAHLAGIAEAGRKVVDAAKAAEKAFDDAKPSERKPHLEAAVAALEELRNSDPGASIYIRILRKSLYSADKDQRVLAVGALLETENLNPKLFAAAREVDPKNEHGLFEKAVAAEVTQIKESDAEAMKKGLDAIDALEAVGTIQDEDVAVDLFISAATWSWRLLEDKPRAVKYAKKLKAMDLGQPGVDKLIAEIMNG